MRVEAEQSSGTVPECTKEYVQTGGKARIRAYIFAAAFLALLVLPRLIFPLVKEYVDTENYENRVYQEKPALTWSRLKEYPGLYDAYFNDYLPFKNPLIAFGKLFDIQVFGEIASDTVLMGKDNWMFYRYASEKEDSLADYCGTNLYSQEELERLSELLTAAGNRLEAEGVQLVLYIVPNKEQVYSEYMPSSVRVVEKPKKAERLYGYLREHTEVPVRYPLEEFRYAKDHWCQVYRKYDTHWNDIGAFMGAWMIMQDIEGRQDSLEECMSYAVENRGTFSGDLASMLVLHKYYDDDAFLKVENYKADVSYEMDYENAAGTVTHYSSEAEESGRKILICRDSFGTHMAEYFARSYPKVWLADYRTEDCAAAAEELEADVVVIEIAERYTDYLFSLLENLGSFAFRE